MGGRHGGLWKTNDNGDNWQPLTDDIEGINGIASIAIDPFDGNEMMLLSSKDWEVGIISMSNGLYTSNDGGVTWSFREINIAGEPFYPSANYKRLPRKIIYHPTIQNRIFIVTQSFVILSNDGGFSWTIVYDGDFDWWSYEVGLYDIEFDTENPDIVYISGHTIQVSHDGGISWSDLTNLITGKSKVRRAEMAVSELSPGDVWFFIEDGTESLLRFSGTFPPQQLILNSNLTGGRQCLECEISKNDAGIVYLAGLKAFRYNQSDGSCTPLHNTYGGPSDINWVHTDIRSMVVKDIGGQDQVILGHDGGISYTLDDYSNAQQSWNNISDDGTNGLQLTEFYGIGSSEIEPSRIMGGCQDLSAFYFDGENWYHTGSGDGGETVFSSLYQNTLYHLIPCCYGHSLKKSINGGEDLSTIYSFSGSRNVFSTLTKKPYSDTLLVGWNNILVFPEPHSSGRYYSLNLPNSSRITDIEVSDSNLNLIYASTDQYFDWKVNPIDYSDALFRTVDNGTTWNDISSNIFGLRDGFITDIEINPNNETEIWITFGMSTKSSNPLLTKKIYKSSNSGTTWDPFDTGLPEGVPVSCIEYDHENDVIYIGTDIGVFYRRRSTNEWLPHNTGLPYKIITDIDINRKANRLMVATMGRGIWKTSLLCYEPNFPLVIDNYQVWSDDQFSCADIIIENGGTLVLQDITLQLFPEASIIIRGGGFLRMINQSKIENCNMEILSGGYIEIEDFSKLILNSNDNFNHEKGAHFNFKEGSIEINSD